MTDTKEKILQTSLYLFALDGYEGVSVSNIADELDMSKGAIYKHYKNKRDIFNSIIERMKELGEERSKKYSLSKKEEGENIDVYRKRMYCKLKESIVNAYHFWTEDPFARDFRRMIILEQFRNPEMNDLYQQFLVTGPVQKLEKLFKTLQKGNPDKLAYLLYSKVYLLISISDSAESLVDTEMLLQEHLEEFGEHYFFIKKGENFVPKKETHKGLLQRAQEING